MRRYTDKFVRQKFLAGGRLNTHAACAFPGKYPLRIYAEWGRKIYHGKFTLSVWRALKDVLGIQMVIYDKAGAVFFGSAQNLNNSLGTMLVYRYFGRTWLDSQDIARSELKQAGPYKVYAPANFSQQDLALFEQNVNRLVPQVKNA